MKARTKQILCMGMLLVLGGVAWAQQDERETEQEFRYLLRQSQKAAGDVSEREVRRVEDGFRRFLRKHPQHARAMVAYGGWCYERGREDEGVRWWEKAIEADPREAYAYNELANHYGHSGRPRDALRYYEKAMELGPKEPVFRFNWATMCVMYRKDSAAVYGWDTDQIFRHGLDQFRKARDLAPEDFSLSSAYAGTFYLMKTADWKEAYEAWKFCLQQPLDEVQRQQVYGHLVRFCLRLDRREEARQWLDKITGDEVRRVFERKFEKPGSTIDAAPGSGPTPAQPHR